MEDLAFDIEGKNCEKTVLNNKLIKYKCPIINIEFEQIKSKAIIDTGSEVDCIATEIFDKLDPTKVSILPVSNIKLLSAFGGKSYIIKKQIMIKFKIEEQEFLSTFLVVPRLNFEFVFGTNWCGENKVDIKYSDNTIIINNKIFRKPTVTFMKKQENNKLKSNEEVKIKKIENEDNKVREIKKNEINLINKGDRKNVGIELKIAKIDKNKNQESKNEKIIDISNQSCDKIDGNKEVRRVFFVGAGDKVITNPDHDFNLRVQKSVDQAVGLSEQEKHELFQLILKYKNIFSDKPGCIKNYEHEIRLKNDKAIIQKNYPVPLAKREKVRKKLAELEELKIIEQAISKHKNPLRITEKSDGEIRICLDARKLNDNIEPEHDGPLDIDDILQKYEGKKVFSTTDLPLGFFQIPLKKESRKYTAFTFEGKSYQFCRIPFGIKTASNGFVRALNKVFDDEVSEFCTVYVDDILLTSQNFDEHLKHLEIIFNKIEKSGLTITLNKSFWCKKEVKFLGFILTPEALKPDPDNLKAISEIPSPKNRAELQGIIEMCGYY